MKLVIQGLIFNHKSAERIEIVKEEIPMKKLFDAANHYIATSDWKIIAVLKFCLISLGMMIGIQIRPEQKKPVFLAALSIFSLTYIPLMIKFYRVFTGKQ